MHARLLTFAAALLAGPALAVPAAAPAPAPDSEVRAFVSRLYDHEPDWEAHPQTVFDAGLSAQINLDGRLTDDPGDAALSYDPMCSCQDKIDMRWRLVKLTATPATARADITVTWPGPSSYPQRLTLVLARTAAGWRIHDVATHDTPSLLAYLITENRRRSHR